MHKGTRVRHAVGSQIALPVPGIGIRIQKTPSPVHGHSAVEAESKMSNSCQQNKPEHYALLLARRDILTDEMIMWCVWLTRLYQDLSLENKLRSLGFEASDMT